MAGGCPKETELTSEGAEDPSRADERASEPTNERVDERTS